MAAKQAFRAEYMVTIEVNGERIDTGEVKDLSFALNRFRIHVDLGTNPKLFKRTITTIVDDWEEV